MSRTADNRIFSYSLDRTSLLPSEKLMMSRFLAEDNKLFVWKMAKQDVNPTITFGNVVDEMENVFNLSTYDLPSTVGEINQRTVAKLKKDHDRRVLGTKRSREFGFVNGKIPSVMVPRPSMEDEEEEEFKFRFYN